MNRIAVFAHFDTNNFIEDYVIYYLKELKKVTDKIIFVSDSTMDDKELSKISHIVHHSIAKKHGEYDFGSYKRGYLYLKENNFLNDCEELIFANDSCYGPLFPFDEMFSKMSVQPLDFWGVTSNALGFSLKDGKVVKDKINHVQSFFLVFKPTVFNSDVFSSFINSIKHEDDKEHIIVKYEVGLTKLLEDNGFKYDVYCQLSKTISAAHINIYRKLIKEDRFPLLKRNFILYKEKNMCPMFIRYLICKYTKYDCNLIIRDRAKNARKLTLKERIAFDCKGLRRQIIRLHFKDRSFCLFGTWYCFGKEKSSM